MTSSNNSGQNSTICCIVGGGPAGMMLGFLLARAGVGVTVLEKHNDFFRDFRGDTIHPSTLQLMYELGLYEELLKIRHSKIAEVSVRIGDRAFTFADFRHLPTQAKYIALMPQWDFLNFLAAKAAAFPTFTLRMGCEVTGLLREDGVTTGVIVKTADGIEEISAPLTVGCDGRNAVSREAAHLPLVEEGVPIDVLWLRLSRHLSDPENGLGYVNYGRFMGLINRIDYFQVAYLIAKGTFSQLQQAGLSAFRQEMVRIAPFLADRIEEIDAWDKVKLLTVKINRLEQWSSPGLLCIGDAAHAMSPVGGIGINIALQDAVATANLLSEALKSNSLTPHHLVQVQRYRERAVKRTQAFQVFAHRILNRVLLNPGPVQAPVIFRFIVNFPGFKYLTARVIGVGLQPEHIAHSAESL
ncbi:MAG: FAD-dependent oxidoreductase [Acidobacteria bacterium]|nr:FAD-dependent oxidoreductase [Acidobacteriota bacterium]